MENYEFSKAYSMDDLELSSVKSNHNSDTYVRLYNEIDRG